MGCVRFPKLPEGEVMAACSMDTVLQVSTEPTVVAGSHGNALSDTVPLSRTHSTHACSMYAGPHFVLIHIQLSLTNQMAVFAVQAGSTGPLIIS